MLNLKLLAEAHNMRNERMYFKVAYLLQSFKVSFSFGLTVFRYVKKQQNQNTPNVIWIISKVCQTHLRPAEAFLVRWV